LSCHIVTPAGSQSITPGTACAFQLSAVCDLEKEGEEEEEEEEEAAEAWSAA